MSKVYDALKRAEREGQFFAGKSVEQEASTVPAPTSAPSGIAPAIVAPTWRDTAGFFATNQAADNQVAVPGVRLKDEMPGIEPSDAYPELNGLSHPRKRMVAAGWRRILLQAHPRPAEEAPVSLISRKSTCPGAEKFQLLRLWFEAWVRAHNARVIMMTSALPGEGKSFVALNLSVALASAGSKVMLIDADLRRPRLHHAFELPVSDGLLDFLEGQADFAACLKPIQGFQFFKLVASARASPNAARLIAGRPMADFLEKVREFQPAHYIIIDAPAALAAPDAEILSNSVDAALLVVAANRTPREMVKEAAALLNKTTICGVVLNRFQTPHSTERKIGYDYYQAADYSDFTSETAQATHSLT